MAVRAEVPVPEDERLDKRIARCIHVRRRVKVSLQCGRTESGESIKRRLDIALESTRVAFLADAAAIIATFPRGGEGTQRSKQSRAYGHLQDNLLKNLAKTTRFKYVFSATPSFWVRFLNMGTGRRGPALKHVGIFTRAGRKLRTTIKNAFDDSFAAAGLATQTTGTGVAGA